jgi:hypothetical protein
MYVSNAAFSTNMKAETVRFYEKLLGLPTYLCAGIAQSLQRLATGWAVPGPNPRDGKIFRTNPDPVQSYSFTVGTGCLFRGQSGRGVSLTTHPKSSANVKESRAMLLLLWAFTPSSRANFTYKPDRTMPYAILQKSHCW